MLSGAGVCNVQRSIGGKEARWRSRLLRGGVTLKSSWSIEGGGAPALREGATAREEGGGFLQGVFTKKRGR